ncbi:hypothetical protein R1flu_020878 [Riccia fluitans]|uniref:Ribosomal protein L2 n=1 Tax=Riccia fluitans TaxID=41844 RepID=A0ABD1ZN36_9MARC
MMEGVFTRTNSCCQKVLPKISQFGRGLRWPDRQSDRMEKKSGGKEVGAPPGVPRRLSGGQGSRPRRYGGFANLARKTFTF